MPRSDATANWRLLVLGWMGHLTAILLLGLFQQDYRELAGTLFNTPLMWIVHSLHTPTMDRWMIAISSLGRGDPIAVLFAMMMLTLWTRKRWQGMRFAAVAMLGAAIMAGVAKLVIHSARPELWPALEQAGGSSFPSSHASGSMSLALTLVLLMPKRWQIPSGGVLVSLAVLVGISRVYLGVHAPTDILLTWWLVLSWTVWIQHCLEVRKIRGVSVDPVTVPARA